MSRPKSYRIQFFEVREALIPYYINKAREEIQAAIRWRKNDILMRKDPSGVADYLKWAKADAEEARRWCKKIGVHFGKLAKPPVPAAPQAQEVVG